MRNSKINIELPNKSIIQQMWWDYLYAKIHRYMASDIVDQINDNLNAHMPLTFNVFIHDVIKLHGK